MKVQRILVMALVAVMALFIVPSPAHGAEASNRDNCRGYVHLIYRSGTQVAAAYRIQCDRTQDEIFVYAEVSRHTRTGITAERAAKTCTDTRYCIVTPKISNPSGSQLFAGSVFSALATRGSYGAACGYTAEFRGVDALMSCTSADKFL